MFVQVWCKLYYKDKEAVIVPVSGGNSDSTGENIHIIVYNIIIKPLCFCVHVMKTETLLWLETPMGGEVH